MTRFLCIRLYGPMVAWGDIAVGDRRPASAQPSRSGVLGLFAGALGLERGDEEELAALDAQLGFASRLEAAGELLVDYHTAQAPRGADLRAALKKRRIDTRRDELEANESGNTLLSFRTYFVDALASAAVWKTGARPRWSLEQLSGALAAPQFAPYLGRKACPLGLPTAPRIVEAEDPVAALRQANFGDEDLVASVATARKLNRFAWEGAWPELRPARTVVRRDRMLHRGRWQFAEREEHQLQEGGGDVP